MRGGGSERRYFRFRASGGATCVGVISAHLPEVRAFLGFTRHFSALNLPVPRLLAERGDQGVYVLEDLGDFTLAQRLAEWRSAATTAATAVDALRTAVQWLPALQVRGGRGLDYSLCFEGPELGRAAFQADLEQFLAQYVPRFVLAPGPVPAVREDLQALVERVSALPREHFCHRDFQTRNMMWRQGAAADATPASGMSAASAGPVFLDYQGGRRGPLAYDLASLLYSPDSALEEPERQELIALYLRALAGEGVAQDGAAFRHDFYAVVLLRRLQALGAYARMAVVQGLPEYLQRIPPALATLRLLLGSGALRLGLPALEHWLEQDVIGAAGRPGNKT